MTDYSSFRSGRSNSSFGTWYVKSQTKKRGLTNGSCAAMNGIPPEIVQRADNLVLIAIKGEDLISTCCQMPSDEMAELEEAVRVGDVPSRQS